MTKNIFTSLRLSHKSTGIKMFCIIHEITDKVKRELSAFEQQKDNALSVFGPHIPRLLRRIEEEYNKGRFKEKPRGPIGTQNLHFEIFEHFCKIIYIQFFSVYAKSLIGAYIKMKDAAWVPAVESFLGEGTLSTFCVDNNQDAKFLSSIMKEIYYNENTPAIISSKFFYQVRSFVLL